LLSAFSRLRDNDDLIVFTHVRRPRLDVEEERRLSTRICTNDQQI